MMNTAFDFNESFSCHVDIMELEHSNKFCLLYTSSKSDFSNILSQVYIILFDFLFHMISLRLGLKIVHIYVHHIR